MSNTQHATKNKPEQNGQGDDKQAQQAAQQAEAQGKPRTVDFGGNSYEILEGQPSPKALTYVARAEIDDETIATILAVREMLGSEQWNAWSERHTMDEFNAFWIKLNRVAGGGEGN